LTFALFLQPRSITRTFRTAATLAVLLSGASRAAAQTWTDAPAFLAILAPSAHRDAYRTAVTPSDLDTVLAALARDPSVARTPGAWTPRLQSPLDAFGRSGAYNRWTLARLYGARQPRVARGLRTEDGRAVESWTLISPYPDPRFEHLEPGTLLVVLRLP